MLWFLWASGPHLFASNKKSEAFSWFKWFKWFEKFERQWFEIRWFEWFVQEKRRRLAVESLRRRLFAEGGFGGFSESDI